MYDASDFGVPQLRPGVLFVAVKRDLPGGFLWPMPCFALPKTPGETLEDLMAANGWKGARSGRRGLT